MIIITAIIRNNIDYNVDKVYTIHTYIYNMYTYTIYMTCAHGSNWGIESSDLFDTYKLPTNNCISMCNDLWCNCGGGGGGGQ